MGAMAQTVLNNLSSDSRATNRKNILKYEEVALSMPQLEIPVKHYIHGGMYVREITIPANTAITGAIYKFDHFDIMIKGDITVSTDDGITRRLEGYNVFQGQSGKKRAGFAHEDTTWITVHPFTGDSGESIQEFITAQTFDDLHQFNIGVNKQDFEYVLQDLGTTKDQMLLESQTTSDMIESLSNQHLYTSDSDISGKGLYSNKGFSVGDTIGTARVGNNRTIAGRYTNHALYANSKIEFRGGDVLLISTRIIDANEEITINYRDVIVTRALGEDL